MSKQSDAKEEQGYTLAQSNCGNCAHYRSEVETHPPHFSWAKPYTVESNRRCGIGGFAVKKTASCKRWDAA